VSATQRHRTIVLAKPEGQLGNRLFLSATLLAHAAEQNLRLLNPALGEYADFFQGTCGDRLPKFPIDGYKTVGKRTLSLANTRRLLAWTADSFTRLCSGFGFSLSAVRVLDICESHDREDREFDLASEEFRILSRGRGYLFLRGWKFRAHEALEKQHSLVRQVFCPVQSIQKEISDVVSSARAGVDRLIGVHVRQGDYRKWLDGKYFFENAVYMEWMRQAANLWPDEKVGFLLCTNGAWEADRMDDSPVFRGPGSAVGDLYALAECDGIMGPPSSFSLWASYYNRVPLHMLESADQEVHPVTFTQHRRI